VSSAGLSAFLLIMPTRKIVLLGQTGAGKSSIGNKLLQNDNAFKPAPIGSPDSLTTEVQQSQSTIGDLRLVTLDTPGLGDTKGRSIEFLNVMMEKIKAEKPHGLIFVINGGAKHDSGVKYALKCFAQCLKPSHQSDLGVPAGRILLVVNHLPADSDFGGSFAPPVSQASKDTTLAQIVDQSNELVCRELGAHPKFPVSHTFGIQKNDVNLDRVMGNIRSAIACLPEEVMDVGQFRPFHAVMREAQMLESNAISAEDYARQRIETIKYDIGWHKNRIRDCTIANAATCWIPFVNIATTIGFVAAIEDSRRKIPDLEKELKRVEEDKVGNLEKAKARAVSWMREMRSMEDTMRRE